MTGGCLCGAVQFVITPPSLFCGHCHCAWCRKAHGAAFVTWLGAATDRIEIRGDVRWYRSSEASERGFCPTCGTTMFFRSTAARGETHVALGCLDGEADRAPTSHVFVEAAVPWVTLGDALPRRTRDHVNLASYAGIPSKP